jgi:ERCC4-type nuclease
VELDYADFMFLGNGPAGDVYVGVERKTLGDILKCIRDARFSGEDGQLDGMLQHYQYAYLVIEGGYRCDPTSGVLQQWHGREKRWQDVRLGTTRYMHSELQRFLISISMLTPIRVWRTRNAEETVLFIADLYQQFVRKQWAEHKSTSGIHMPEIKEPVLLRKRTKAEENELYRRRVALCSTRIGQDKSKALARHFNSAREMLNADVRELCKIDGIGKKSAEEIVKEMTNAQE